MAEASAPTEINCPADPDNTGSEGSNKSDSFLECAVCLQPCVHPAQLPCGHIFCFLCVKGIANQSKKCAMCRQEIPRDFTEQPKLVEAPQATGIKGDTVDLTVDAEDEGYRWFYEGRNGWWQYDERTSKELEQSHKEGVQVCELLIAGFLYIVDLGNMVQARRNDPLRRRKIKRDLATIPKKGVAGLRSVESSSSSSSSTSSTTPPVAVTTASTESSTQSQQTQTTRARPQQAPVIADPCAQAAPPQPPPQASSRSARRRRSSGGSLNATNGTTSISTTAGGIPPAPASSSDGPRTRSRSHRGSRGSNGDVTESNVSGVAMATTACLQQQNNSG